MPNMSQHLATGWPNACIMLRPAMLRYAVLKCCDRLVGACHIVYYVLLLIGLQSYCKANRLVWHGKNKALKAVR